MPNDNHIPSSGSRARAGGQGSASHTPIASRVLIADQSYQFREILQGMLHYEIGVTEVLEARSGEQVLEILEQTDCDLVIADTALEPMNGIELTQAIRKGVRGIDTCTPVILVSSRAEVGEIIAARDAGANEYLAKPLSTKMLRARMLTVLSKPRPFVRADGFFGPDRRRHSDKTFGGADRRVRPPELVMQVAHP